MNEEEKQTKDGDVLDFIIFEDIEDEINTKPGKTGCFGMVILLIIPIVFRHFFILV
jgi:hypothetical protein